MLETTTLYRPVGKKELDLIAESGFLEFPPRLPEQPFFYPVLSEDYAVQIARDWNARLNEDKVGYVTRFAVSTAYLVAFEVQCVGSQAHKEFWIPAGELPLFNQNIIGAIEVIAQFRGDDDSTEIVD